MPATYRYGFTCRDMATVSVSASEAMAKAKRLRNKWQKPTPEPPKKGIAKKKARFAEPPVQEALQRGDEKASGAGPPRPKTKKPKNTLGAANQPEWQEGWQYITEADYGSRQKKAQPGMTY